MVRKRMQVVILLTWIFISPLAPAVAQRSFLITAFGAKGDSKTYNTKAIQKAIDAAAKAGKGKVIVPAGYFVTGPILLKPGVELHLNDDAVLLGSTRRMDYGGESASPLIGADGAPNVSITGKGLIDGRGRDVVKDLFRQLRDGKLQDDDWKTKRPTEKNRPRIMTFNKCSNVRVSGVTIKNGAGWIQDYVQCSNVTIDSIRVESTEYWNNDGIDIVNCKNVRITNCYVDAADDAICLKSEGEPGWCENVYVGNCTVRSSASGFKIGTGSRGGFRNIRVRDLEVHDTYRSAIALEAVDGGFLEDVDVENVTATNTGNAILIRLGHRNKTEDYSTVRNITIKNMRVEVPAGKPDIGYPLEGPPQKYPHNVFPASITGIPGHLVENVRLENIEIVYEGGARKETAFFAVDSLAKVPENIAGYPEFSMFGELPAWGLYVRHVTGLTMKNVTLTSKDEDFRTAIICDDVRQLKMDSVAIPSKSGVPIIILNNVTEPVLRRIQLPVPQEKGIKIQ